MDDLPTFDAFVAAIEQEWLTYEPAELPTNHGAILRQWWADGVPLHVIAEAIGIAMSRELVGAGENARFSYAAGVVRNTSGRVGRAGVKARRAGLDDGPSYAAGLAAGVTEGRSDLYESLEDLIELVRTSPLVRRADQRDAYQYAIGFVHGWRVRDRGEAIPPGIELDAHDDGTEF